MKTWARRVSSARFATHSPCKRLTTEIGALAVTYPPGWNKGSLDRIGIAALHDGSKPQTSSMPIPSRVNPHQATAWQPPVRNKNKQMQLAPPGSGHTVDFCMPEA